MKIQEIIRQKRLEKGLTQEQLAERLGVTAPAVNKWEKGVSYPEITLLPVLARLLGTDLNTLLSFREDLTREEVEEIVGEIRRRSEQMSFEEAYIYGMEKVTEFPNSYSLLLNVGVILEGVLLMKEDVKSKYARERKEIENLYQRALASPEEGIASQAKVMLISAYRERKEYEKAQELIDTLPDASFVDKTQVQISTWIAQKKYEDAGRLAEQQMTKIIGDVYGTLLTLMELAMKEGRIEDAKKIGEIYKKTAMQFEMWEYGWYVGDIQLYSSLEDWDKFLETLELMLLSLKKEWSPSGSVVFHYTDVDRSSKKEEGKEMGAMLRDMILNGIYSDQETAFLKDDPRFLEMLERVGK